MPGFAQVGYDILNSTIDRVTRKILLQLGDAEKKTVDSNRVEQWQQYGMISRPPKPVGKDACQAVILRTSDYDIAIASMDLRGLELYGDLDYGEVCIYSAGVDGTGQARALWKSDGSVSLYTRRGNTPDGAGMMIGLDAQNGVARVMNDQGFGLFVDQDGVKLTAGDAGLTLKANGTIKLIGTGKTQIDGSSIVLGSTVAPVTNAALVGATGLVGIASTKVLIALA